MTIPACTTCNTAPDATHYPGADVGRCPECDRTSARTEPLFGLPPIPAHYKRPERVPENYELRGAMTAAQMERWHGMLAHADRVAGETPFDNLLARAQRLRVAEEKWQADNPNAMCDTRGDSVWSMGWVAFLVALYCPDRDDLKSHVREIYEALLATGECL